MKRISGTVVKGAGQKTKEGGLPAANPLHTKERDHHLETTLQAERLFRAQQAGVRVGEDSFFQFI